MSDGTGVGIVYMCESISVHGLERGGWIYCIRKCARVSVQSLQCLLCTRYLGCMNVSQNVAFIHPKPR